MIRLDLHVDKSCISLFSTLSKKRKIETGDDWHAPQLLPRSGVAKA